MGSTDEGWAQALKGHLDVLLLAASRTVRGTGTRSRKPYGKAVAAGSTCPPAPSTRPCTDWRTAGLIAGVLVHRGRPPPAHLPAHPGRISAAARRPQQLARVRHRGHRHAGGATHGQPPADRRLPDAAWPGNCPPTRSTNSADGLTETWQRPRRRRAVARRTRPAPRSPNSAPRCRSPTRSSSRPRSAHRPAAAGHRPGRRRLLGRQPHRGRRLELAGARTGCGRVRARAWPSWSRVGDRGDQPAQLSPHPPRHAGGLGLVALDVAMVAAVLLVAPTLVWPMLVAISGQPGPHRPDPAVLVEGVDPLRTRGLTVS